MFSNIIHKRKEIYGEVIVCPPSLHADGRTREEESGPQLVLEKITELGIDPAKVLYFRRTQPTSESPNPELYWTSAYFETVTGLNVEITGESRKSSVILCSTLEDIASDSELILDKNDDVGLAVRRVSLASYSQSRALFIIKN